VRNKHKFGHKLIKIKGALPDDLRTFVLISRPKQLKCQRYVTVTEARETVTNLKIRYDTDYG